MCPSSFPSFAAFLDQLPVREILPELRRTLAAANRVVLAAPPGSGKTTGLPLALLNEKWLAGRTILMLEPRRLAARGAAHFLAALLGEPVGATVGYRIRFEQAISARTRLEIITEGILSRLLQQDPALERAGLIIFDEFHERSLQADLALALTLDSQEGLREDLRVLVMSATLEVEKTAATMQAATITAGGRQYPVTVNYLSEEPRGSVAEITTAGIRRAWQEQAGDLLAFLPGGREIHRTRETLAPWAAAREGLILPLYGDLPPAAQQQALQPAPGGQRRLVLATSIAETSLTLEGITTVIDAGWSRVPRFDPNSGLSRLETIRVSRAAADQRAGRAGRQGPGACYRLWTEHCHRGLVDHLSPEILSGDLAGLALELAAWGTATAETLTWLDPPPAGPLAQARELLRELGALNGRNRITPWGKEMLNLPLHPRLANMLLQGAAAGEPDLACDLAAVLSEREVLAGAGGPRSTDLRERLQQLERYRAEGPEAVRRAGGEPHRCRQAVAAARQWRQRLARVSSPARTRLSPGNLLAFGYPDRIGRQRPGSRHQYLLASGRGAFLPATDLLAGSELLVAAQLDAGQAEARIFQAAPLTFEELRDFHSDLLNTVAVLRWDEELEGVVARQEERLGSLTLASRPWPEPDQAELLTVFVGGLRKLGPGSLPWTREARDLQARVLFLRTWQPEAGWPDLGDEHLLATLEEWLGPHLRGITRRSQLQQLNLAVLLHNRLAWPLPKLLAEGAPTHWRLPDGSRRRLLYEPGAPPVLAARVQELFGWSTTPAVCWGRVPVLLHLLSPAGRPVQITRDLAGFWQNSYSLVKKELKGRYPKHFWPEDPLAARPTSRAKPRRGG